MSDFGETAGQATGDAIAVARTGKRPVPFLKNGVLQVGQIVKDLDRAIEGYWKLFGIGPWKLYTYRKPLLRSLNYHGKPVDSSFRIGLAWIGPLCIELIEAGEGDSIYADFVREHGYGLHHLGVAVEDVETALAQAEAAGVAITQDGGGQGADGSGYFGYLDTEDEIGTIVELIQFPKERRPPERIYPPETA